MANLRVSRRAIAFLTSALLIGAPAFAQDDAPAEEESSGGAVSSLSKLQKDLKFDLGIVPDTDGNVGVGTGFVYDYFEGLNFGSNYSKITRSLVSNSGGKKNLAIIEEEIIKFKALGYKIHLYDDRSFKWAILPSVNGQRLFQKQQLNDTDRTTDTFDQRDTNLLSWQVNTELQSWMEWGGNKLYFGFDITPYSVDKESAIGYNNAEIASDEVDPLTNPDGNLIYSGPTGDYTTYSEQSTNFFSGKMIFEMKDLLGSVDMMIGLAYSRLHYTSKYRRYFVNNGEKDSKKEDIDVDRQDLSLIVGAELAFLDFGMATPLGTFNLTQSQYQNAKGKTEKDFVFGFGLTFKN